MLDEVLNISLQTRVQIPAIEFTDETVASDDQLVNSVIAGDEAAFREIFDRYKRPITRVVGRFFRERTDVEEFVQQSFTKAYFSIKRYHGGEERSFAAWMTRIAVNVCYDEFRRRQRKGESLFTEMNDEETDYISTIADGRQPSAERSFIAAQLAEKILAGLDADDRVAMTLVYSEERSLDEVAGLIGITTSNLKSRLFRCRNHIKKRFGHIFV
jgi:RNA polymerase sigma-70 factor (ECF subfamily)